MYIIETVPLTNLPLSAPQVLTYFSSSDIAKGSLLIVSLRNRKVKGICLKSTPLRERKQEVKEKKFKLSAIEEVLTKNPALTPEQIELAFWVHQHYIAPLGTCLRLFLPKSYLNRRKPFDTLSFPQSEKGEMPAPTLLWQKERDYKDFLEPQTLVLSPEIGSVSHLRATLNGSPQNIVYHSQLSTRTEREAWTKVATGEAETIFGTRSSIFLPYRNLQTIIIDCEEDDSFKSWDQHPRYHAREVAYQLSQIFGAKLILGTSLPSLDSYLKTTKEKISLNRKPKEDKSITVINMKKEREKKNFSILGDKTRQSIEEAIKDNKKVIVFTKRRGFATSVTCQDCGHTLECSQCDTPLVYHREQEKLICHHCHQEVQPPKSCPKCESWQIKYSGTGTQKVEKELGKMAETIVVDSDRTPTEEEQRKTLQKDCDILIGTNLMLKEGLFSLLPRFSVGVVLSTDSLTSFPDYRAEEEAFRIFKQIQDISENTFLQTYSPGLELWQDLQQDSTLFLKKQLDKRRMLSYPPFSEIVRLTYSHKSKRKVDEETEKFKSFLEKVIKKSEFDQFVQLLGPTPSLVPRSGGLYSKHLVLKIKDKKKPIKSFLRNNLPRDWRVDINPLSLLS